MSFLKATPLLHAAKQDTADIARFKQHSLIGGNLILNDGTPVKQPGNVGDQLAISLDKAPNNFDNIDKTNLDLYTQIRPIINQTSL